MRGERFCVDSKYEGRGKAAVRKQAMHRQGVEKAGCINRRIPPGRPVLMCSFRDIRLVGEYRFNFGRTTAHPALLEVLSEYFSDTAVASPAPCCINQSSDFDDQSHGGLWPTKPCLINILRCQGS